MIADRLDSEKIVFGLKGTLVKAIDELCARSSIADLASHFRTQKPDENERYSCIGHGIAVPHVRVDHLAAPELVLGISPEGLSSNNHRINVVLLLATPAEQPQLRAYAHAYCAGTQNSGPCSQWFLAVKLSLLAPTRPQARNRLPSPPA